MTQSRITDEEKFALYYEAVAKGLVLPLTCLRCGGIRKDHQGYCDKCFKEVYKI
jgi:uncharacterized OB-fold protein